MSEATRPHPSPRPRIRGDVRRAATISSGSSAETAAKAKSPRSSPTQCRIASARPAPPASSRSSMWATTSESVSDERVCPSAASGSQSSL